MVISRLKGLVRRTLQGLVAVFVAPVKVNKNLPFKLLGHDDAHYFVGYYDKDPIDYDGMFVLCHKVRLEYENHIEPNDAQIGLLSRADNSFAPLTVSRAMNWQLASRAQWVGEDAIIYNDVVEGIQCSVRFQVSTKEILSVYQRPFWDISPDKSFGASLNFARIKKMRPGYGYKGTNIDGDSDILTVFSLENDRMSYMANLDDIIKKYSHLDLDNKDLYLNHIVWSPCSKKLLTIFHYEDQRTSTRKVFPILINIETGDINLLLETGYFSHHTFIDDGRILAYIELDTKPEFAIWSENGGWQEIGGSMPDLDGHPTYISSDDRILVDSHPNRLGIMSLFLGSPDSSKSLDRIAYVLNNPKYVGALRCDLHPRFSKRHDLITCDIPHKRTRKIMMIEGALHF